MYKLHGIIDKNFHSDLSLRLHHINQKESKSLKVEIVVATVTSSRFNQGSV